MKNDRNQPPVGFNESSGAEKVERIEQESQMQREKERKEFAAAQNRVEAALEKKRAKELKMQEKRLAETERQRIRAEKQTKAAQLRAKKKEERAKAFEAEIAAIEEEKRIKKFRRDQRRREHPQRQGFGGWLAAVITLGATTLVLTALVTLGAIEMYRTTNATAAGYRATMYELIGIVEKVDDDLDALRVAGTSPMQSELLTDVLVQTRMAENDLEKLPVGSEEDKNAMNFLNRTSEACEMMLAKLNRGEKLSQRDIKLIERLYEMNHQTRETLDELAATVEDKDIMNWMKGVENRITDALERIENAVMPPERKQPPKTDGENGAMPLPSAKKKEREGIPSSQAEELCKNYFADYNIESVMYAGETLADGLKAYNFEMKNGEGTRLFAQISQADGALIEFDFYQECHQHVIDIETARGLAESFLVKLGYENMIPVRVDEEDTNVDFEFVYSVDGCTYYPDSVTVKVCEERGVVIGLDASDFLKNHTQRGELQTKITMEQAKDKLSDKLTVEASRLVLFEHDDREYTAYEFFCSYGGEFYFVYTDAMNGNELFIVNAKDD